MTWSRTKRRRQTQRETRRAANRRVRAEIDSEFEKKLFVRGPPPPEPLWHFTTWAGFEGILSSGKVWATHYTCTNDASEVIHTHDVFLACAKELLEQEPNDALRRVLGAYDSLKLTAVADLYLASFCAGEHDAQLWYRYGDKGTGVAMGLRLANVHLATPTTKATGITLAKLEYDTEEKRRLVAADLRTAIEIARRWSALHPTLAGRFERLSAVWMTRAAGAFCAALKEDSWRAEQEWRLSYIIMKEPDAPTLDVRRRKNEFADDARYVEYPLSKPGDPLPLMEIVVGPVAAPDAEEK